LKISCPPSEALELAVLLKHSLERPRYYGPTKLSIQCEFKLGRHAAGEVEFKQFKPREFEEAAFDLAAKAGIDRAAKVAVG
ncbi:MAG TPA: hypothetical protein VIY48_00455, partial [Candidatus Paceibacterota bacterium]